MYFVGIDISKFKHDCFITTESGVFVTNSFSIKNDNDGFQKLLSILTSLDHTQEIRIGFEATAHYALNLKLFLEKAHYSFMEFNRSSCEVQQISNFTTYQNGCYRLHFYCSLVNDSRIQTLFSWILSYIFT